ncbi:MAG: site-specific integrase [Planctomycetes bacterium]|nr:site-specific integrase [Planctomycetota bacterium]
MENKSTNDARDAAGELVMDRVRIFLRGKTWYANFQHGKRQNRVSLKTGSKKEARRRAMQIEGKLETGRWEPEKKASSIADATEAYLNYIRTEERAEKTIVKYSRVMFRVNAFAVARRVSSLDSLDLQFLDAFRRQRVNEHTGKKVTKKTLYNESTIIRQLVNFAVSRKMLAADPLAGLKLEKPKPTPQPCWTYEELQKILAASPAVEKPAFILLSETGMRLGELQWLTWDDVDFDRNCFRIRPKEGWKPKSGDERMVPISELARQTLESLPRRWPWVVTMPASSAVRIDGRQWSERRLLGAIKRVLKPLGLPGKLHTFRHTFISNALLNNVPVAVVREWVGHVDDEIIELYTHVHDDASQAAMQRLAKVNDNLQTMENSSHGTENASAQNQHSDEEGQNARDAK